MFMRFNTLHVYILLSFHLFLASVKSVVFVIFMLIEQNKFD